MAKEWLLRSIKEGAPLGHTRGLAPVWIGNEKRLKPGERETLEKDYETELGARRLGGLFRKPPRDAIFRSFVSSLVFAIPKPGKNKWRKIDHLSFPSDTSVNDGIEKDDFPVAYPSIRMGLCALFCKMKRGALISSRDISHAYRHVLLNPSSWYLIRSRLGGQFYFNAYAPFGASSCPGIFSRFSDASAWTASKLLGLRWIINLFDDFFSNT